MRKIRTDDLIYEHNCVTVPLFFTPRAQAAQARMQLASPVSIINTINITKYGMVCFPDDTADQTARRLLRLSAAKSR